MIPKRLHNTASKSNLNFLEEISAERCVPFDRVVSGPNIGHISGGTVLMRSSLIQYVFRPRIHPRIDNQESSRLRRKLVSEKALPKQYLSFFPTKNCASLLSDDTALLSSTKKVLEHKLLPMDAFLGRNVLFCCWQLQKQLSNYCLGTHFVTFSAAFCYHYPAYV